MKKFVLLLSFMILSLAAVFAQAPQKMSYQAVVRDANSVLVKNHNVSARITILQGGVSGTPVCFDELKRFDDLGSGRWHSSVGIHGGYQLGQWALLFEERD